MATPTLVTVTGRITTDGNTAAAGDVTFTAHRPLVGGVDDTVIAPFKVIAPLDGDGEFTVQLPATNDPDWLPLDWAYSVRVNAGGGVRGSMALDYEATSVDFDDVLQTNVSAEPGRTYVRVTELGQPGGPATLGLDGKLAAGQRPPSDVVSVNGATGAVVLTSGDLGIYVGSAEPSGAADGDIWFDTSGA